MENDEWNWLGPEISKVIEEIRIEAQLGNEKSQLVNRKDQVKGKQDR